MKPWHEKEIKSRIKLYSNIYEYLKDNSHNLPFKVVMQILEPMTWQEFVDILNLPSSDKKHLVTLAEEDFRKHEKKNTGEPFFSKRMICDTLPIDLPKDFYGYALKFYYVEFDELKRWIENNPDVFLKERSIDFNLVEEYERICNELNKYKEENERLKKLQKTYEEKKINIRSMWQYVLDLENEGMSDQDIYFKLAGIKGNSGPFSGAVAATLLYKGDGRDKEAVEKWRQREFSKK